MESAILAIITFGIVIILLVISIYQKANEVEPPEQNPEATKLNSIKKPGMIAKTLVFLWMHKETRLMMVVCAIIYFASFFKIEIKIVHDVPKRDITINHDFGGNMNKPISLKFSDPGYPIKFEIINR